MACRNRRAKINLKVLVILVVVVAGLGVSLVAARQIRRKVLSARDLRLGTAAFENENWSVAYDHFIEYLGRHPDDLEILKKCAKARLSVRPVDVAGLRWVIAAYRQALQEDPNDGDVYSELAMLYGGVRNFNELAYIARMRLERLPSDEKASLWLANALIQQGSVDEAREVLATLIPELRPEQPEYEQACVAMSSLVQSADPKAALEWLNRAVGDPPDSAVPLAQRARFYRVMARNSDRIVQEGVLTVAGDAPAAPETTVSERLLGLARQDLEAADQLQGEEAKVLYFLVAEWMAHGDLEQATIALESLDNLSEEVLNEQFFDPNDWITAKYQLTSDLLTRRGEMMEAASLAQQTLETVTGQRHRAQVLPSAIPLYARACDVLKMRGDTDALEAKVQEVRRCLEEYRGILQVQQRADDAREQLAEFDALVARAENRPYAVIEALQLVVARDPSRPRLWRLLAEAYAQTNQPRRAIGAFKQYQGYHPEDKGVARELARQYSRLGDQDEMLQANQRLESLDPNDATAKLLRVGVGVRMVLKSDPNAPEVQGLSEELNQLRAAHPQWAHIRILQAALARHRGSPEQAEAELKLAIEECADPLQARMQLVNHYRASGRTAEAIDACRKACEQHAGAPGPWVVLAGFYVAEADHDSARECLMQRLNAIKAELNGDVSAEQKGVLGREKHSLFIALALLERDRKNEAACIEILTELAEEDKEDVHARRLLLSIPKVQTDSVASAKLIAELREIEGDSGLQWRLHQATVWLSSDQWRAKQEDITELLQHCISADSQWSAPVLLLGGLYERLSDPRQAIDVYDKALIANPSDAQIASRLLTVLGQEKRFDEAESVLKRVKVNPQLVSAWETQAALQAGDASRAIDMLEASLSEATPAPGKLVELARLVYQESRDVERAFGYLKKAEALTSDWRTLTAVKASIYRQEGQTAKAKEVLDTYVAGQNDFMAHLMRGSFLVEEGDFEGAEQDYLKLKALDASAVSKAPDDPNGAGRLLLSDFYAGHGDLDNAIRELEEALELKKFADDDRFQGRLMRRLLTRDQGTDRARALDILAELESELPREVELVKIRVDLLLKDPNWTPESRRAAQAKLAYIVEQEPDNVKAHVVLVRLAMQNGDYATARDLAIKGIGSNPDSMELLVARCDAELALGNTRVAIELGRLVLQEEPDNVDALVVLAKACRLAGDVDQSEQWIGRAEAVAPDNLAVVHARFLWRVGKRRFAELVPISAAYLSAPEQNLRFVLEAAAILGGMDSMDLKKEGVKLFEYGVTLSPESLGIHLGLATTLYQMGEAERAKTVYRELLNENENNVVALNDLAWILQEHEKNYEEALELTRRGLKLAPDNVHLLDTRGTIFVNMQGHLADAKADFERIVELSSSDVRRRAQALLQLGRICVKRNELAQAKQHLQGALEIDRENNIFTAAEKSEISAILR
jgi:tetratricopeptide (TPR) repeat protein